MPALLFPLLFVLLFFQQLGAQSPLEQKLRALEQDRAMDYGVLGFCLIDVEANKIIMQRNANMSLIPASSLKVVSTGTALAVLGGNYRYETYLEYDGQLNASTGVLKGNVYIRGTGDPSLASPWMDGVPSLDALTNTFCAQLQAAGIRRIDGQIIGDASAFDDMGIVESWQWGDLGPYYGAGAYGLNMTDNFYTATFRRASRVGQAVALQNLRPDMRSLGLKFHNTLTAGPSRSGDKSYFFAAPYDTMVEIRGTLPAGSGGYSVYGAIPNPPLFAAQYLRQALIGRGVEVQGNAGFLRQRDAKGAKRQVVYTHRSPRLTELVKHTNERSRNHYCEAFLKSIAQKRTGKTDTETGTEEILSFWAQRGIDTRGFFLKDGSGLSARNGIPAKVLAQILRKMYVDEPSFYKFDQLLSVCGESGTLKGMAKNTSAQGNIRAKSGSIGRVRSYCGYVRGKSGKEYCFAIIANNYTGSYYGIKQHFEKIFVEMTNLD